MKLTINIDGVNRDFYDVKPARVLNSTEWDALGQAERRIYAGNPGAMGYTDVMMREDSEDVAGMWDQCFRNLDGDGTLDGLSDASRNARVAARVARAQAVLVFGPEFLIR